MDARHAGPETPAPVERPSDRLSPRLRSVLLLRIAGYTYVEIAEIAGIGRATVHKYMKRINRLYLKGITGEPSQMEGREVGYRLAYVYGLLDAGCTTVEVQEKLKQLDARVRRVQIGTPRVKARISSCNNENQLDHKDG